MLEGLCTQKRGEEFIPVKDGQKTKVWGRSLANKAALAAIVFTGLGLAAMTLYMVLEKSSAIMAGAGSNTPGIYAPYKGEWTVSRPFPATPDGWYQRILTAQKEFAQFSDNRRSYNPQEYAYRQSEVDRITQESMTALTNIGKPAIPVLLKALRSEQNSYQACQVLSSLGAATLMPLLEELRTHSSSLEPGCKVLRKMGRIAGDKLAEMTVKPGADREFAAEILARMANPGLRQGPYFAGYRSPEKIMSSADQTVLVNALKNETVTTVRKNLIVALSAFSDPHPETITALSDVLKNDKNENCRKEAARDLAYELSTASPDGAEPLVTALSQAIRQDKVAAIQQVCIEALRGTKDVSESDILSVRQATHSQNDTVRREAFRTLMEWAKTNHACVQDLVEALGERDTFLIKTAIATAKEIGEPAKATAPFLEKYAVGNDPGLPFLSMEALAKVKPEGSTFLINYLTEKLRLAQTSENLAEINRAIECIDRLGPATISRMKPVWQELAQSNNSSIKSTAEDFMRRQSAKANEKLSGKHVPLPIPVPGNGHNAGG